MVFAGLKKFTLILNNPLTLFVVKITIGRSYNVIHDPG